MRFKLSDTIERDSGKSFPDARDKALAMMANLSAPYTLGKEINRRYMDLLFRVEGDLVVRAYQEDKLVMTRVRVVCSACDADGGFCAECDRTGELTLSHSQAIVNNLIIKEDDSDFGIQGASPHSRTRPGLRWPVSGNRDCRTA